MTDREKFLNTARSYIGKDGYFVCKTKLALDAVYDWCAFAVSAIMKDCGFIGKYTSGVHSFASDEGRYSRAILSCSVIRALILSTNIPLLMWELLRQ